ncbi:MAG: integration host factor, actinobacterial type [Ilumatobacteraceae bacterium]
MAAPPSQTPEQLAANLEKAAAARAARSELKQRVKTGDVTLAAVLDAVDDVAQKLKVVALLESLPGVGKVKARRIMDDIGIPDNRRVQGLGAHQKQALVELLGR